MHTSLRIVILLLAALCLPRPERAAHGDGPRKNVLLICVDDLKPALGCYGDRLAKSPNIDRLAARGMRFEMAYCNQAVCAPSRNNLLLGSRSTSLGIYNLDTNFRSAVADATTLTQHFMNHGYRAEAIGKVLHTGHGNHDDRASWTIPTKLEKVVEYLDPRNSAGGKLTREEAFFTNQRLDAIASLPRGAAWEASQVADDAYADGRIADEAIRRLQAAKHRANTPFFLALGFVKPHLPLTAPQKYWDLHDSSLFELATDQRAPDGAPRYAGKHGGEIVNYDPLTVDSLRNEKVQRKLIHAYYACVSYVDAQIGRVLDELDRLKLADQTIIVLWGDHGWHLGDHGFWTKHTNYEQANRIPLLVVAPGITQPESSAKQLAETVDVFPTLSELADLPAPTGPQPIDGASLVPVLRDGSTVIRDHAYHCFPRGERIGRAIRTARYRLVEWKKPGDPADTATLELYDYQTDPAETKNLASSQPAVVSELRKILDQHPEAVMPGRKPNLPRKNKQNKP